MRLLHLLESMFEHPNALQQARSAGLRYAGYGRWKDSRTGKIVAKTHGDRLIMISGVGDGAMDSPADFPNDMTAEPIAGDSIDGPTQTGPEHDTYQNQPFRPTHVNKIY